MAAISTVTRTATPRRSSAPCARRSIAGVIAFGLFVLLIGLKTDQNIRNELILVPRWGLLAIVVAHRHGRPLPDRRLRAALARRAQSARQGCRHAADAAKSPASAKHFGRRSPSSRLFLYPVAHRAAGRLPGLAEMGRQFRHPDPDLRDAGLGPQHRRRPRRPARSRLCRLLRGRRLLPTRCSAQHFGLSFWILLPAAGILAAFWGIILGFPVLRLRGDYLAIVTLAFGEIIRLVLINWREVTNGTAGISGIPKVTFFGLFDFNVSSPDYIAKVFGIAAVGRLLQDLPLLPHPGAGAADRLRHDPPAPHAGRPRLGSAARGRDRLPLARHQHHQHQADGLCHRRHVRRLRRLVLRRAPGLRHRRNPSSSWNRRSSSPSSCSAAWAR